jgi:hypothetical protein
MEPILMFGFDSIKSYFGQSQSRSSSALALILVNLFPIFGVFYWGWQVFPVLFLFWSENLIIGFYTIMRILSSQPKNILAWISKLFMVPFFIFHYGMFTFVHGLFVVTLFGGKDIGSSSFPDPEIFLRVAREYHLLPAMAALFLSHGYSFLNNFIRKGEYLIRSSRQIMGQPYSRIVLMHLTLIFGGFLIMLLGSSLFALLLFILLKIILDLIAHVREHQPAGIQSK